jgi:hypothetical protein
MDFYVTTSQVIPILLLALIWDSGYLQRLRDPTRDVRFWKKRRVRVWVIFMSAAAIIGEGAMFLVLADVVSPGDAAKALGLVALAVLLGSLAVRVISDIVDATR